MPNWTTLTLAELRAATKAEVIQDVARYMAANMSKRQIIVWLMDADQMPDRVIVTRDDENRITRRVEVNRDPETGAMTGGTVTVKDYYDTGEIKDIIHSTRDADNNETRRIRVRHFTDGRQPIRRDVTP